MTFQTLFPRFGELDFVLPSDFVDVSSVEHYKEKALSKQPNQPRFCLSVFGAGEKPMHDDIYNDNWIETQFIIRGLQEYHTVHGAHREV
jgi:hypothetical protein